MDALLIGGGMTYGGLPFPGTVYPVPGVWYYLLSMKWFVYGILFLHLFTPLGCFCLQTILSISSKNKHGLVTKLPRTSSISDLHTIQRTNCRSVPGLATNFPRGVLCPVIFHKLSQWKEALLCNSFCHWASPYPESSWYNKVKTKPWKNFMFHIVCSMFSLSIYPYGN